MKEKMERGEIGEPLATLDIIALLLKNIYILYTYYISYRLIIFFCFFYVLSSCSMTCFFIISV